MVVGNAANRKLRVPLLAVGLICVGLILIQIPLGTAARQAPLFSASWKLSQNGQDPPAPWSRVEYGGAVGQQFSVTDQIKVLSRDGGIRPREGSAFAKFIVRPGDRYGGSTGERALVSWDTLGVSEGQDQYYSWSTLWPVTWREPAGWSFPLEWHADSRFMLAPIRLNAGANSLELDMTTGRCADMLTCAYRRNHKFLRTLHKGQWNDFVAHIRWTKSNGGVVEVWHRVAGHGPLRLVLRLTRVPTMPWFEGQPDPHIYMLLGLYRAASPWTDVVYQDAFKSGSSFAAVTASRSGSAKMLAPPR